MMNPYRGEVMLVLNGEAQVMRLTLGALAELESALKTGSLLALVERFEQGSFSASDLVALLLAGLRGGGADIDRATLNAAEIKGGAVAAAQAGALLLKRAFTLPDAV
ncbi:MAG: gene transfer agent family protein [Rhodobacteraceae bacterium]|nr:gene transfer agent family protein [Paracoccaceae bacterium]